MTGPLVTVTLCGLSPFQTHLTRAPLDTVIDFALKASSLTVTVLVVAASAEAGTMSAAAASARARR